jgi:ATP phosphoribosyltransferase
MIDIIDKIISISANQRIKIAFQKKGRLTEVSRETFRSKGVEIDTTDNEVMPALNQDMEFYGLRDDDVPGAVAEGDEVKFGIVGTNVLREKYKGKFEVEDSDIVILKFLERNKCRLSFAFPAEAEISGDPKKDMSGKVFLTSYPNLTKEYFTENKIDATVKSVEGGTEVQCRKLKRGDAICDLVESGKTLEKYDLAEYNKEDPVMNVDIVLIANRKFWENAMSQSGESKEVQMETSDVLEFKYGT